jgi:hypothetical protein
MVSTTGLMVLFHYLHYSFIFIFRLLMRQSGGGFSEGGSTNGENLAIANNVKFSNGNSVHRANAVN